MVQQQQRFVGYARVSTQAQGQHGLGVDAQRSTIEGYVRARAGELVEVVVEVQSGKFGTQDRPELARAIALCRAKGAALVVGRLDRLARDVKVFLELVDASKIAICFCDLPDLQPGSAETRMMLTMMAGFAEFERRKISERTSAALQAAKRRGVKLGVAGPANLKRNVQERQGAADAFAHRLSGLFEGFRVRGLSQRAMVAELNAVGVKTAQGGEWRLSQVQRTLARLLV